MTEEVLSAEYLLFHYRANQKEEHASHTFSVLTSSLTRAPIIFLSILSYLNTGIFLNTEPSNLASFYFSALSYLNKYKLRIILTLDQSTSNQVTIISIQLKNAFHSSVFLGFPITQHSFDCRWLQQSAFDLIGNKTFKQL